MQTCDTCDVDVGFGGGTDVAQVKSASEWVVDKLISSQETLTKFVVFAHHKTVLDLLQEVNRAIPTVIFVQN